MQATVTPVGVSLSTLVAAGLSPAAASAVFTARRSPTIHEIELIADATGLMPSQVVAALAVSQ